jgi:hypothetical protein
LFRIGLISNMDLGTVPATVRKPVIILHGRDRVKPGDIKEMATEYTEHAEGGNAIDFYPEVGQEGISVTLNYLLPWKRQR